MCLSVGLSFLPLQQIRQLVKAFWSCFWADLWQEFGTISPNVKYSDRNAVKSENDVTLRLNVVMVLFEKTILFEKNKL